MSDHHARPRLGRRRKVGGDGEPEVFCADELGDGSIDIGRWSRLATDALLAEGVRGLAELSVLYVGEEAIAELNQLYMGKAGPTDVLAFPIDAGEVEVIAGPGGMSRGPDRAPVDLGDLPLLLGDVVICPPVAAGQAEAHAGTFDDELALLLVHGVLHVLGYDHAEPDEQAVMQRRERELLEAHHWHGPAPAAFRQDHADAPDALGTPDGAGR
jgi:probable rRNA maturation factor